MAFSKFQLDSDTPFKDFMPQFQGSLETIDVISVQSITGTLVVLGSNDHENYVPIQMIDSQTGANVDNIIPNSAAYQLRTFYTYRVQSTGEAEVAVELREF